MKNLMITIKNLLFAMLWCVPVIAYAQEEKDKTESPYFWVLNDEKDKAVLPLKSTGAEVAIAGVIADVKVSQVYQNEGKTPIEAIYIFPASTRAAVYHMKMKIGEREIIAVIEKKEEARQQYEEAKESGKTASLLEQLRPNVFQMNVANIMPGDEIVVDMRYTELLIPENGMYEFVYPTVVGPRYGGSEINEVPSEPWVENPYTKEGESPLYDFTWKATLSTGVPISELRCTSHQTDIAYKGKGKAEVILDEMEKSGGNRDLILQYKLKGNEVETGLLLYEGKEENFFLAMVQPPDRIREEMVPPREYVFIVDISGSMHGYPLNISKKMMKNLLQSLRPSDKFNVMLFAGSNKTLFQQSQPATEENIRQAMGIIDRQQGGGGTELLPALQRALTMQRSTEYSRMFVILTDGYVTVERDAFELIRNNLSNANFFPFGIGTSVNRYLIEGMAHTGNGIPFVVTKPEGADVKAEKFREYISYPVLTNIKATYQDFEVYDVEPLNISDVLSERPVILFGKWKGTPAGSIVITGENGEGKFQQKLDVSKVKPDVSLGALKYLWAREKIRLLDDFAGLGGGGDDIPTQITELGLKYQLLTRYTSFIAIDSEIRNNTGEVSTIKQPLPLPEGVSNLAIRGAAYSSFAPKPQHKLHVMEEVEFDDGALFLRVEKDSVVKPEFKDGEKALQQFIKDHLQVPESVKEKQITGYVFLNVFIGEKGEIVKIEVLRGVDAEADKEALRVLWLSDGMWNPGMVNGKPAEMNVFVPVKI